MGANIHFYTYSMFSHRIQR